MPPSDTACQPRTQHASPALACLPGLLPWLPLLLCLGQRVLLQGAATKPGLRPFSAFARRELTPAAASAGGPPSHRIPLWPPPDGRTGLFSSSDSSQHGVLYSCCRRCPAATPCLLRLPGRSMRPCAAGTCDTRWAQSLIEDLRRKGSMRKLRAGTLARPQRQPLCAVATQAAGGLCRLQTADAAAAAAAAAVGGGCCAMSAGGAGEWGCRRGRHAL